MPYDNGWNNPNEILPDIECKWVPVWVIVEDTSDYTDSAGNIHKVGNLSVEPDDWFRTTDDIYVTKYGNFYRYGDRVLAWKEIEIPEIPEDWKTAKDII